MDLLTKPTCTLNQEETSSLGGHGMLTFFYRRIGRQGFYVYYLGFNE